MLNDILPLLIPIIAIQIGLVVAGLWDLSRPGRRVKGDSRALWAIVIIFVNVIGPLVYFLWGRDESR